MSAVATDKRLESRVASQDRRDERHVMQRKIYDALSTRSAMKFRCTVGQLRAAAKSIAMNISQQQRKEKP